jgi:tRNA A-37 threonylcarbamoyl transferase component Bud32
MSAAASLRGAGREPPAPCELAFEGGGVLAVERWLRVLPGKRLTGAGRWNGQAVLAKLFIAARGAERHWRRECQGAERLQVAGLPTPALLAAGRLAGGGHYVLYAYLENARGPDAAAADELARVFTQLGRLHAAGLLQEDAHLGNFLLRGDDVCVIDGDAVRPLRDARDGAANLALLFAQLPPSTAADRRGPLLAAYRAGNPAADVDETRLAAAVARACAARLADYLGKCLRDCSLFRVEKTAARFVAMARDEADFLAPIVADPDRWLAAGTPLKLGRTATLARVEHAGRVLVIKRYNIKGPAHALSRCWRPSRAWHSWIEGQRLRFLGIATPRPLALIERRLGPLRGKAWLITEYCAGESLTARLADRLDAPPRAELAALGELFARLAAARISHGDLKATNLLWEDGRIGLVDLDAMRQHAGAAGFARAWRRDRARLLRNWPAASALARAVADVLPPA